nr:hypothetical protein 16 [Desulfobulbaceae bacterium]
MVGALAQVEPHIEKAKGSRMDVSYKPVQRFMPVCKQFCHPKFLQRYNTKELLSLKKHAPIQVLPVYLQFRLKVAFCPTI